MHPLRATDPSVVGGFSLLGRLGAGGMGEVFLGVTRSGRPVAVKMIKPEIAADPKFRARFVREVAAARRVGGFWTASVVEADPEAEAPWLATEYVAGPSLGQAVAEAGRLPVATVRVVAARLAEALAAIHAAGLVHRDLKPANVLLGADGPKVIDFGVARTFLTETAGAPTIIGTPGYMSPEQLRGEQLTSASDVFALGGTLVFALVGRGPFQSGAAEGVLYRVLSERPDLTEVPADLRWLIAACLAKDPADRPSPHGVLTALGPPVGTLIAPYGQWQPPRYDPAAALLAAAPRRTASGEEPIRPANRGVAPVPSVPAPAVAHAAAAPAVVEPPPLPPPPPPSPGPKPPLPRVGPVRQSPTRHGRSDWLESNWLETDQPESRPPYPDLHRGYGWSILVILGFVGALSGLVLLFSWVASLTE